MPEAIYGRRRDQDSTRRRRAARATIRAHAREETAPAPSSSRATRGEVVALEGAPRLLGGRCLLGFFGARRLWSGRALSRRFDENLDAEVDAVLVLHFLRCF